MSNADTFYASLIADCLTGERVPTRNGECLRTICKSVRFTSTPLVSLRRTAWRNALREMEFFLSGSNHIDDLHEDVRHWWRPWVNENNVIPNSYGSQFKSFAGRRGTVDQVEYLARGTQKDPYSRRHVITTWNTADMVHPLTTIANCHGTVIQAFCHLDGTLSLKTYQRSADVIVGVPHNVLQYWAVLLWLCHRAGRTPRALHYEFGDAHIYQSHETLARKIIDATPPASDTPELVYEPSGDVFRAEDFELAGPYSPVLEDRASMVV